MKNFLKSFAVVLTSASFLIACGPSSLDVSGDEASKFDTIQLRATAKANGIELEIIRPGNKDGDVEIVRQVEGDPDFQPLATISGNKTIHLDKSATVFGKDTKLVYKARILGANFPWSNAILGQVQEYLFLPTKPNKPLVNAIGPTSIQIGWGDENADVSTQGFRLRIKEVLTPTTFGPLKIIGFGVLIREYLAQNGIDGVVIAANKKYAISLEAYNTVGAVESDIAEITTPAVPANPTLVPNTPTATSFLQISADKLRMRWTVGPTVLPDAANGVAVYVCKGGVCDLANPLTDFTKVADVNGNVLSYDYTIPNLPQPNGTRFGFVVRTKKGAVFSPFSNKIEMTLFNASVAPGAPELIQVQQLANKKFNLQWDDPETGDQATSLKIYFAKNNACSLGVSVANMDLVATVNGNLNQYTHDAAALVNADDTVCYALSAVNSIGESDLSNRISLIVGGGAGAPASAPTLNQVTQYSLSLASVYWSKATGATSYKIVVQSGNACMNPTGVASWPVKGTYGDVAQGSVNFGIIYEGGTKCFAVVPYNGTVAGTPSNVGSIVGTASMEPGEALLINTGTFIATKSVKSVWNYATNGGSPKFIEYYDCVGAQAACDPAVLSNFTLRATKQSTELVTYVGGVQAVYEHFYVPTYPWASGSTVWFMIRVCNTIGCTNSNVKGVVSTY